LIYTEMTDQARNFIAKYMADGRMCSPYSLEWMADHADRQGFEPKRVEALMKQVPEFEGHLLVLDISQAEAGMLEQLSEMFPGLGRWFVQLGSCPGVEPMQVYFNLLTHQVLAVAIGSQDELHTYDAMAERPCLIASLYCDCCGDELTEFDIEFSRKFGILDFMNVIPRGLSVLINKSAEEIPLIQFGEK
jgi:hypothetical protein